MREIDTAGGCSSQHLRVVCLLYRPSLIMTVYEPVTTVAHLPPVVQYLHR